MFHSDRDREKENMLIYKNDQKLLYNKTNICIYR